jgi:MFS family permease
MDHTTGAAATLPLAKGVVVSRGGLRAWMEAWFLAYGFLAIVQGGLLPMLLPLTAGGAAHAGVLVGAMNLAGLSAPAWGILADSRRWHRQILVVGFLAVVLALALLPGATGLGTRLLLVVVMGLGFSAANTLANTFIVEVHPAEEWDARIGALQTCLGLGQVTGLLLAGLLGGAYGVAFAVATGLVVVAVPIAWATVHTPVNPTPRREVSAQAPIGAEGMSGGPHRHFHHVSLVAIRHTMGSLASPFSRFLLIWVCAFTALTAVITMFPYAMLHQFGASSRLPATVYAMAAAVSLGIYGPAGMVAHRRGPLLVLSAGLLWRTLAVGVLAVAALGAHAGAMLAMVGFFALVLGWPLMGVAGTALAAHLSPLPKGEAIGLFGASSSLAGAVGALAGGWGVQNFGYGPVCLLAAVVLAGAFMASRVSMRMGRKEALLF